MNTRLIRFVLPAVLAIVLAAAACGGGTTKGASTNALIEGSWQFTGGTFLPGHAAEIGTLTYLDVTRSGDATLYARTPFTGILGCAGFLVAVVNESTLTAQIPPLVSEGNSGTFFFTWVRNGSELTLTDSDGNSARFQKVDAVPAAAQCGAVTTTTLTFSLPPDTGGGIGSDGTKLYWTDSTDTQWVTFDPATLSTSAIAIPITAQYGLIRAVQGPKDFWNDCRCGANEVIQRMGTSGTAVDTIDTSAPPINMEIIIEAGTFHASHLWLAGDFYNGSVRLGPKLLKIDSEAEPDTLTASFDPDVPLQGIAFAGTRLFAVAPFLGYDLVELDPSIGTAIATWKLPAGHYYGALAVVGNTLWIEKLDDGSLLFLDVP
ncbi:MAG TPA: hypothetical protein VMV18_02820 [bacterium]|nr:hypothetical protein [bacterium]